MQKPTPPQERAYMPYWALNPFGDGTEEINVMVSGEGSPIKEDELGLEDRSSAEAKDISDLHRVICERFSGVGHEVVYANPRLVGFIDAPKS